jgi:hypothetical protein
MKVLKMVNITRHTTYKNVVASLSSEGFLGKLVRRRAELPTA